MVVAQSWTTKTKEAVVLPDEDEAADQTADDDIVGIGGQTPMASMMMKSPIPRRPQMKVLMERNPLALKMALYHMILRFWLLGGSSRAPWITSPFK